jgi:hypothetical protein
LLLAYPSAIKQRKDGNLNQLDSETVKALIQEGYAIKENFFGDDGLL